MLGRSSSDENDRPSTALQHSAPAGRSPDDRAACQSDEAATEGWDNEGGHDDAHPVNE